MTSCATQVMAFFTPFGGEISARIFPALFILFLVFGVPVLSFSTAHDSRLRQMPRLDLYFSAALSQWVLAAVGLLVFILSPMSAPSVGFRRLAPFTVFTWAGALVALSVAGIVLSLFLENRGWWPAEDELVYLLVPKTRQEKACSLLFLAPTAALCEEFLYRGFLLAQIGQWLHSSSWAWAASSLAFGLGHAYQGWSGAVRASLLGALLAYPVIHFGSLYPSMLAHGLIDALALVWLGPKFLKRDRVQGMGRTEEDTRECQIGSTEKEV